MNYKLTWKVDPEGDFEKDFETLGDMAEFIRSVALLKSDYVDAVYITDIKTEWAFQIVEVV